MASPFGPLTVIVNPHAGHGRVAEEVPELERQLRAKGLEYTLRSTEGPGDATRLAREAVRAGARFLVAVGGDGTVHEVVNGMMGEEGPLAPDLVLGVVAAGSGCDLVRTFGLPGDATRACHHLVGDSVYPMDLMRITYRGEDGADRTRYGVNVAEAGLGAAVAARAERLPRFFGRSRYFVAFWLTLPRFRLARVRVQVDRRTYEGPAFLVVVGNCQFYGAGMRVSPRSYPGDGVLDVLVFKGPRSDAFTMIPRIYRGEHVPHDHIAELRARTAVRVEGDRALPVEADGEVLGTTPAVFQVVPRAILMKV
ncbi:MAG TPA: diacylglycerol kinase family protein [Actinomycetota bacterium]|nr:diacylglycerol kinase family protein [Actinomycetota bacterium]